MKLNNKKGFTIVELVIVIAVIAILAGVLIPTFSTVIENANKSAALQEAKTAMEIVAMEENASLSGDYFIVTGKYVFLYDADENGISDKETKPDNFTKKSYSKEFAAKGNHGTITLKNTSEKQYTQEDMIATIAACVAKSGTGTDVKVTGKAVYYANSIEEAYNLTLKESVSELVTKGTDESYTVNTGIELTTNTDISKNVLVIGFKPVVD